MSIVPKVLEFSISNALSPVFKVELANGVLRCGFAHGEPQVHASGGGEPEMESFDTGWDSIDAEFSPTQERWAEFRERLDAMGAFDWQELYENESAVDGWAWSLRVQYSDVSVTTRGLNEYPDSDGLPTGSRNQGFRSLARAMHELSGCERIEELIGEG